MCSLLMAVVEGFAKNLQQTPSKKCISFGSFSLGIQRK
jgi:hypothetical protein